MGDCLKQGQHDAGMETCQWRQVMSIFSQSGQHAQGRAAAIMHGNASMTVAVTAGTTWLSSLVLLPPHHAGVGELDCDLVCAATTHRRSGDAITSDQERDTRVYQWSSMSAQGLQGQHARHSELTAPKKSWIIPGI
jgi:hypothetical protein